MEIIMQIRKAGTVILTGVLTLGMSAGLAFAQDGARQDMKNAGHETSDAAQDAGHGISKGTRKAYHKTANGTDKAYHKTANGTDKAYHKTKRGTEDAYHDTARGTKHVTRKVEGKPTTDDRDR